MRILLTLFVLIVLGLGGRGAAAEPPYRCDGRFSDGNRIDPANPVFLNDVPQSQFFCDFHTFAWNQFIYLTLEEPGQGVPRFMRMAPWYNLLKPANGPAPSAYPGGPVTLSTAFLNQNKGQADGDYQLIDTAGRAVRYDIRFNQALYEAVAQRGTWNATGFAAACAANADGNCTKPMWLPPSVQTAPGAIEVKTAWRDFETPAACPASYYCNGRFGLAGMHIVQKTFTHGEWVWMSFEHEANDPDCRPGGDTPIAAAAPGGQKWAFFDPQTAGEGVMKSRICPVAAPSPRCDTDPRKTTSPVSYGPVNVCRTDILPPNGASPANCYVAQGSVPQSKSNSPGNVACLNATLRPKLDNVWRHYKMIGSEWVRGSTGPETPFTVQVFQPNVAGVKAGEAVGFPNLANTTMETWAQKNVTGFVPPGEPQPAGCFGCHNLPASATQVFSADTGSFASDDLSHFPGKFRAGALPKLLNSLMPAKP